jgi:hypothetical protein
MDYRERMECSSEAIGLIEYSSNVIYIFGVGGVYLNSTPFGGMG